MWKSEDPIAKSLSGRPDAAVTADVDVDVRILVADDDPQVRRLLVVLLQQRWGVAAVGDGEAAWAAAQERPPDLILSDVRMPKLDGIELLRRLRAAPATRGVPVILLSGHAGEQETIDGLEAGADDYIVKPFSGRELLVRVQTRLDVTAMRKQSARQEEALASLERQQRWTEQLLDTLPVPLLLLAPGTGCVRFANGAALRIAGGGIEPGTPLGQVGRFERGEEGGGALAEGALAPSAATQRLQSAPLVWRTPAGSFSVLADSELIPSRDGHEATIVLTLRDVTPLVRAQRDLRETLRVRDEFLSIASHELRTPLTTLGLQTDGLLRTLHGGQEPVAIERLARRLETIRKQTVRLEQLVDKLLDVSHLVEGRLELHAEELDLVAAVREAIETLRGPLERSGSTLSLFADSALVGRWDRLRVYQVVTNLLSNAIKFGGGKPIEVTVEAVPTHARVRVRDHGVGISAAERARIFERFGRAVSERDYPGLGLGLWITRQIVEACGGTIGVESAPGEGSVFLVELPRGA